MSGELPCSSKGRDACYQGTRTAEKLPGEESTYASMAWKWRRGALVRMYRGLLPGRLFKSSRSDWQTTRRAWCHRCGATQRLVAYMLRCNPRNNSRSVAMHTFGYWVGYFQSRGIPRATTTTTTTTEAPEGPSNNDGLKAPDTLHAARYYTMGLCIYCDQWIVAEETAGQGNGEGLLQI